jgi:hypothetical protein
MYTFSAVFDIMAIVGDYGTLKTWGLLMPGGVQCTNHDMPDTPQVTIHTNLEQRLGMTHITFFLS